MEILSEQPIWGDSTWEVGQGKNNPHSQKLTSGLRNIP